VESDAYGHSVVHGYACGRFAQSALRKLANAGGVTTLVVAAFEKGQFKPAGAMYSPNAQFARPRFPPACC
jgi:hypothetical protein